jgi:hypothetical protein
MTKASPTNLLGKVEGTNSLRDIKPPVEIPSGWVWALWLALALALAALAWWWSRRGNRAEALPSEDPTPPHVRAKRRLREAFMFLDDPNEFCTRVSSATRWYLEERFDFRAPERTTEEFLIELQNTNLLTPQQKNALSGFLQRCDLVKFARYEPTEPELRDLHDAALRLVEETEPAASAPAAPGAQLPSGQNSNTQSAA